MKKPKKHRYIELDLLRTLAVLMMVVYHAAYDLQMVEGWNIDVFSHGWILFARATASLFLLLVGCSFAISWNRHAATHKYVKYLKRGLGVLVCGMLVSLVTYVYEPETFVRFGILHLIGVSILLLPFFARMREWNLLIGTLIIFFQNHMVEFLSTAGRRPALGSGMSALVPLGIIPPDFATVDYFPLIPWFGVVLIGYAMGYAIYIRRKPPVFSILNYQLSIFSWPGRHALLIYLLHQPILLGILGIWHIL